MLYMLLILCFLLMIIIFSILNINFRLKTNCIMLMIDTFLVKICR